MSREIRVQCPGCKTELVVDGETGRVLRKVGSDLSGEEIFDDAVDKLRHDERTKGDRFDRLMRSQEGREERLEEQFDRAKRRVAENPDEKPRHPFDLD